jgi:glucokinase
VRDLVLAADIGGTNCRLALVDAAGGRLRPVVEQRFASRQHPSFASVLTRFLAARQPALGAAGIGVAGPVVNGRCDATNLPWVVDSWSIAAQLGLSEVTLVNDLEAIAYGLGALDRDDFLSLNAGQPGAPGNQAIIAAGTGLGEAGLWWDGTRHRPFASEGGHADFAPRNALEMELLRYLLTKYTRVSYERLVSGPGLLNIYGFLRDTGRGDESPELAERLRREDPAAVISRAALEEGCPLCAQALDLFVSLYGAEAGNLALKMLAVGGVFVAGGIAPKILPSLTRGAFVESFLAKGRLSPLLAGIPVQVVLSERAGLLGAARAAIDPLL